MEVIDEWASFARPEICGNMADKYIEVAGDNHPEQYACGTQRDLDPIRGHTHDIDRHCVTAEGADSEKLTCDTEVNRDEEYVETRCGYYSCRPPFLQRLNNPPVLCFFLCVYTLIHGKFFLDLYKHTQSQTHRAMTALVLSFLWVIKIRILIMEMYSKST